jgi:hypothetical protein
MNESEFLKYVLRPLTDEELTLLYKANSICYERCGLYSDFIQSLMDLIKKTYLGDDVVVSKNDRESHFNWCLTKIIDNFKAESIKFFYDEKDKDEMNDKLVKYWEHIFKYSAIKTKSELDTMVDVYKIFEKSLFLSEKNND